MALDDLVDETVLESLLGIHEVVALCILFYLWELLTRVICNELVQEILGLDDVLSVDGNICCLAFRTTERLVNHDFGVGESEALSLGTGHEDDGATGRSHTKTDSRHIWRDELHRVVHGHGRCDLTTWGVDVKDDVLLGILLLEEEELSDDGVGDIVIDRCTQEHNAFLEEARVDVVHTFTELRLLDHRWDEHVLRRDGTTRDIAGNGLNQWVHKR